MAKYLDTSQISSELMQLLKDAKEKIILVTYSLQVNPQIQERLKTKSKSGILAEITIIYGNTVLKNSELKWMEEIDDLRIYQKKNLHAKCYINENKAIISSMNLYDYSQTTNIEMGFLITKDENPEAFEQMMEDINDLKINGQRKKFNDLEEIQIEKNDPRYSIEKNGIKNKIEPELNINKQQRIELSYRQQICKYLLEKYRKEKSVKFKENANSILSDENIQEIISKKMLNKVQLTEILNSEKKAKQLGDDILNLITKSTDYNIGKIIDTIYEGNNLNYDKIKMQRFDNEETKWYDTKEELPQKGQIVAVLLNNNWFNKYIILEKSSIVDEPNISFKNDYTKSKYFSTKELSQLIGISSQAVNSILVSEGLMQKDENDWQVTILGEKSGGIQKEGQFGKFIIWPEEIIEQINFNK